MGALLEVENASLGIHANITATLSQSRSSAPVKFTRFQLQSAAQEILPRRDFPRAAACLRSMSGEIVTFERSDEGKFHLNGLQTCSSVWNCPCCAAKITERRREDLLRAVVIGQALGYQPLMITYTFPHGNWDKLNLILPKFLKAYSWMTGHRLYRQWRSAAQVGGTVRALEVTHGTNGWHPHNHVLVFAKNPAAAVLGSSVIKQLWARACIRAGLDAPHLDIGCNIKLGDSAVADYIAKFGYEPTKAAWGVESEMTKQHVKTGYAGGRTPFDLLRSYCAGELEAASLFVEYAQAFKGRCQLTWSPGLRDLFEMRECLTDDEIMEENDAHSEVLTSFDATEWALIVRNPLHGDLRSKLFDVARLGDDKFFSWLSGVLLPESLL
jgi:hypothetical protein